MKYLGVNLTKYVQDSYTENYINNNINIKSKYKTNTKFRNRKTRCKDISSPQIYLQIKCNNDQNFL